MITRKKDKKAVAWWLKTTGIQTEPENKVFLRAPYCRILQNYTSSLNSYWWNRSHHIFLDLSKAFDTIDHNILLDKLQCYGFRGIALDWLTSYISGRSQFVSIDGNNSLPLALRTGVPQGSILGPLLFILYINDIIKVSTDVELLLFADDTNMFLQDTDINSLSARANKALFDINLWFKLNKLSVNIKKCNFILFSTKQLNVDVKICIDNIQFSASMLVFSDV